MKLEKYAINLSVESIRYMLVLWYRMVSNIILIIQMVPEISYLLEYGTATVTKSNDNRMGLENAVNVYKCTRIYEINNSSNMYNRSYNL